MHASVDTQPGVLVIVPLHATCIIKAQTERHNNKGFELEKLVNKQYEIIVD